VIWLMRPLVVVTFCGEEALEDEMCSIQALHTEGVARVAPANRHGLPRGHGTISMASLAWCPRGRCQWERVNQRVEGT
jgi:hypothetical protein